MSKRKPRSRPEDKRKAADRYHSQLAAFKADPDLVRRVAEGDAEATARFDKIYDDAVKARVSLPDPRKRERALEARAVKKMGRGLTGHLAWLVEFSQVSPAGIENLDIGPLEALSREVWLFLTSSLRKGIVTGVRFDPTRQDLGELAELTRSWILLLLADGDFTPAISIEPSTFGKLGTHLELRDGRMSFSAYGDGKALFVQHAVEVLAAEGRRLRRCASPTCGQPFVQRKRGSFCSPRCSRRERMRKYRQNLTVQERYENRHAQYVKRLGRINPKHVINSRGPRASQKEEAS